MSSRIKAIIFDMGGVLIDAKDWQFEALNRALSLFGLEISRYDNLVTYDGLPALPSGQLSGDRREKTDPVRVRENSDFLTLERIKKCPKECV